MSKKNLDVFVFPDIHVPHQDKKAFDCAINMILDIQPDKLVIIGDFADLESLSHHPRNRPELTKLQGELEAVNEALDLVQSASQAKITYIEGNHEYRAVKYTTNSVPHLDGLLDIQNALNLKKRKIDWIPFRQSLRRAWVSPWGVGYMHSAQSNGKIKTSGNHAKVHAELIGPVSGCKTIVYGHSHTFQMYRSANGCEAYCCGFLGDFDGDDTAFDYNSGPTPWTVGCLLQRVSSGIVTTTQVPIVNGKHSLY